MPPEVRVDVDKQLGLVVFVLASMSVSLVAGAVAVGDHHPVAGGALMAVALAAALVARIIDVSETSRL